MVIILESDDALPVEYFHRKDAMGAESD